MKNQRIKIINLVQQMFVLFLAILLIFSCKKDEENLPSTISIISPILNDTVRNNVKIEFEAQNNEIPSYVELYANDSLLGKVNLPATSYTWNTLNVKDGEYTIKCRAFNKKGSSTEDSVKVFIENALLEVDMGELFGTEYNLLITDSAGNILSDLKLKSNDQYVIKPKEYYYPNSINLISFAKN